jgi:hypothetical protein
VRDLKSIAEINGPNHAALAAERAANTAAGTSSGEIAFQRKIHGERVAARRAINNTPFNTTPEYLGQDGIHSAIDQKPGSPFMEFWLELNEQRGTEVRYGEARALFNGGPTPAGALTFVEKGDGFRAIPAPPVESKEAWYGEYREITGKGTKWHRVTNQAGDPIVYTTPTYALNAAVWAKGNAIQKAFH